MNNESTTLMMCFKNLGEIGNSFVFLIIPVYVIVLIF